MSFLIHDRDRLFLWVPVLLGVGAHGYFSAQIADIRWIFLVLIFSGLVTFLLRKSLWVYLGVVIFCLGLGAGVAALKTQWIASNYTPLQSELAGKIKATINDIDVMEGQVRLLLKDVQVRDRVFHKVRVNFKHKKDQLDEKLMSKLRPGVRIKAYVRLFPIPAQETPLNYDFQFWSFFQEIEAVGFGGMASIHVVAEDKAGWFERVRYTIAQKIRQEKLGQKGEIAIALITGYRNGIASSIREEFAGSGIAHILAISGLHLSLIGGLMFLIFRRGLGFFAFIALHWPLKKIAAVLGLLCGFFYLKISGESIPTVRAFIMLGLIMLGIVLDKEPISLRSVAWAAVVILGFKPESIYSPSFQMSFAAVSGLIGVYEYFREHSWKIYTHQNNSWHKKILMYLGGATLSSLIASLATLPFIIHTFHRFSWHSIEANLIAIPLMSFWIMPLVIVVLVFIPLGLHAIPLTLMGWGIEALMHIASNINSLPGSLVPVGVRSDWFILLILMGGLWILVWTSRLRWLGIPLVMVAFLLPKQDIFLLVSQDQSRIGVMAGEEVLLTQTGRPSFVSQDWRGIAGLEKLEKLTKTNSPWVKTESWGWMVQPFVNRPEFRVAIVPFREEELPTADVVVVDFPKVTSIMLKDGVKLEGGFALEYDGRNNKVKIIQNKHSNFPWRRSNS
ncbi:MAG: ComEC/Rec2 family competence protein [Candidatus Paracaedibacteraceae bacterium]|nr:ComEC/Rec2 family competence protein [Candidatus Paracaedibacteraceae bacterium]